MEHLLCHRIKSNEPKITKRQIIALFFFSTSQTLFAIMVRCEFVCVFVLYCFFQIEIDQKRMREKNTERIVNEQNVNNFNLHNEQITIGIIGRCLLLSLILFFTQNRTKKNISFQMSLQKKKNVLVTQHEPLWKLWKTKI